MGIFKGIKKLAGRAVSAATAAPRAVASVVSGDIKNYKIVNDSSIKDNYFNNLKGLAYAGTASGIVKGVSSAVKGGQPPGGLINKSNIMKGLNSDMVKNAIDWEKRKLEKRLQTQIGGIKSKIGDKIKSQISGGINFGKDQFKGLIPVVLAVGAVLFMLFAFGSGKLFSKSKRRR